MPLTANDIITDRVRVLLRDTDPGGVLFKDDELLSWMSDACSEIVRLRPEAFSTTADMALTSGAKQSIPADGFMLLEGICNVTISTEAAGRVLRRIERENLDAEDPAWQYAAPVSEVYRYVPSLTDPRTFHVYPPFDGTADKGVRIVYAKHPAPLTALNDSFPLPDMYAAVAVNYICFRAFGKLIDSQSAQQKSVDYLSLFNGQMTSTDERMEGRTSVQRQPTTGAQ